MEATSRAMRFAPLLEMETSLRHLVGTLDWRRPDAEAAAAAGAVAALGGAIRQTLADWRSAERELGQTSPDNPSRGEVEAKVMTSRWRYQVLFREYRDLSQDSEERWYHVTRRTAPTLLPGPLIAGERLTARR